jgi:rubrerythrin
MSDKKFIIADNLLMSEWDHDANQTLDPNKLTRGSNKNATWICSMCGYKWKTSIYHRAIGKTGCRNCYHTRRSKITPNKSLPATNADIADNWHPIKNGKLTPDIFTHGSRYKAWWQCQKCGNEWEKSIQNYKDCPNCKKISSLSKNNLNSYSPEIIKEWHPTKNGKLTPKEVSYSSPKKSWWICSKCRYEWKARISNRSVLGRGCPACANKVVVEGTNDLTTTHPELAKEWHPTKNGMLTQNNITYGSGKKVWWTCSIGHEYKATILHRAHGTNCPVCNSGRQTSFAEQATYFYIKKLYPDAESRYTASFLGRMELDIYIPSIKYAIEYDGEAWHRKDKIKREQLKYKKCQKQGIKLIRLREKMAELGSNIADYQFGTEKLYEHKNLENIIKEILKFINFSGRWMMGCPIDVDIERDRFKIQKYRSNLKKDSLLVNFPRISKEWHKTKNGSLKPSMFKSGSNHKIWWNCLNCGYEYEATIGHRTDGTGCPKCAIEKVTQIKRKAVNMIDPNTGDVLSTFISISEAARQMKINSSNICMVCKGQRPKAGGYSWSYEKN